MSIDRSSMAPEVSVIIPHYNDPAGLRACLESIRLQTFARERFEVIVADNDSPCDLSSLKSDFSDVHFITAPERGAANARNYGMEAAKGAVFAFIDSDCVADPQWLEHGVPALSNCDLAGGAVAVTVRDKAKPTPVEAFEMAFAFQQRMYIERKNFSVTANLIVRREAALATGDFIHGISEDVEWCRRASALGFRLAFNDTAIVSHPARQSWGDLIKKWDRIVLERWEELEARGALRWLAWTGLAFVTALSAAPHLVALAFNNRVLRLRDKFAAARVLARIRLWRAKRMLAML